LKGFLTFHDIRAKKTHEIDYLLELCCHVNPDFEQFKQVASKLTEYAVDSRYPAPPRYTSDEDAKEAIETACSIYEFVLKSLPDLAEPPQE
jgi:HEPN domain-containing protein